MMTDVIVLFPGKRRRWKGRMAKGHFFLSTLLLLISTIQESQSNLFGVAIPPPENILKLKPSSPDNSNPNAKNSSSSHTHSGGGGGRVVKITSSDGVKVNSAERRSSDGGKEKDQVKSESGVSSSLQLLSLDNNNGGGGGDDFPLAYPNSGYRNYVVRSTTSSPSHHHHPFHHPGGGNVATLDEIESSYKQSLINLKAQSGRLKALRSLDNDGIYFTTVKPSIIHPPESHSHSYQALSTTAVPLHHFHVDHNNYHQHHIHNASNNHGYGFPTSGFSTLYKAPDVPLSDNGGFIGTPPDISTPFNSHPVLRGVVQNVPLSIQQQEHHQQSFSSHPFPPPNFNVQLNYPESQAVALTTPTGEGGRGLHNFFTPQSQSFPPPPPPPLGSNNDTSGYPFLEASARQPKDLYSEFFSQPRMDSGFTPSFGPPVKLSSFYNNNDGLDKNHNLYSTVHKAESPSYGPLGGYAGGKSYDSPSSPYNFGSQYNFPSTSYGTTSPQALEPHLTPTYHHHHQQSPSLSTSTPKYPSSAQHLPLGQQYYYGNPSPDPSSFGSYGNFPSSQFHHGSSSLGNTGGGRLPLSLPQTPSYSNGAIRSPISLQSPGLGLSSIAALSASLTSTPPPDQLLYQPVSLLGSSVDSDSSTSTEAASSAVTPPSKTRGRSKYSRRKKQKGRGFSSPTLASKFNAHFPTVRSNTDIRSHNIRILPDKKKKKRHRRRRKKNKRGQGETTTSGKDFLHEMFKAYGILDPSQLQDHAEKFPHPRSTYDGDQVEEQGDNVSEETYQDESSEEDHLESPEEEDQDPDDYESEEETPSKSNEKKKKKDAKKKKSSSETQGTTSPSTTSTTPSPSMAQIISHNPPSIASLVLDSGTTTIASTPEVNNNNSTSILTGPLFKKYDYEATSESRKNNKAKSSENQGGNNTHTERGANSSAGSGEDNNGDNETTETTTNSHQVISRSEKAGEEEDSAEESRGISGGTSTSATTVTTSGPQIPLFFESSRMRESGEVSEETKSPEEESTSLLMEKERIRKKDLSTSSSSEEEEEEEEEEEGPIEDDVEDDGGLIQMNKDKKRLKKIKPSLARQLIQKGKKKKIHKVRSRKNKGHKKKKKKRKSGNTMSSGGDGDNNGDARDFKTSSAEKNLL